jgi:hypothetical protein
MQSFASRAIVLVPLVLSLLLLAPRLSSVDSAVGLIGPATCRIAPETKDNDDEAKTTLAWGRHYTWPASTLPFQLEMAMRQVYVKKETEQARKKALTRHDAMREMPR